MSLYYASPSYQELIFTSLHFTGGEAEQSGMQDWICCGKFVAVCAQQLIKDPYRLLLF